MDCRHITVIPHPSARCLLLKFAFASDQYRAMDGGRAMNAG
jgi:hypothetical protein